MNLAEADPEGQARLAAFLQALQASGWADSRNVRIETRWSAGDPEHARAYAAELVALAPDVILADGGTTVGPLLNATRTVPVVFVNVTDPIGGGFVERLARPAGNATGFTLFEYSISVKWLELLKEMSPRVKRVAVLRNPALASGGGQLGAIQTAAPSLGVACARSRCARRVKSSAALAHSRAHRMLASSSRRTRWRTCIAN